MFVKTDIMTCSHVDCVTATLAFKILSKPRLWRVCNIDAQSRSSSLVVTNAFKHARVNEHVRADMLTNAHTLTLSQNYTHVCVDNRSPTLSPTQIHRHPLTPRHTREWFCGRFWFARHEEVVYDSTECKKHSIFHFQFLSRSLSCFFV